MFLARDYEPVVGIREDDDWYDQNVLYAYWGVVDDEGLMDHLIETEHPEEPPDAAG